MTVSSYSDCSVAMDAKTKKRKCLENFLDKIEQRKSSKTLKPKEENGESVKCKGKKGDSSVNDNIEAPILNKIKHPSNLDCQIQTGQKRKALEHLLNKVKKRKLQKFSLQGVNKSESGLAEDETKKESFTIIGRQTTIKNNKVNSHLPGWLAHPNIISSDLKGSQLLVEEFVDLDKSLIMKLHSNGIQYFFPVQKEVIPWLLKDISKFGISNTSMMRPRDVCVSAPTGSGKTLAYVVPIIQCLLKRLVPKIRALVVVPVQELAVQVANVFRLYCKDTALKVQTATGKTPLSIEQSKLVKDYDDLTGDYESLVDILVTTPGRLVEHLENTKGFDLKHLRFLVMDEADRMIDNIQNNWLYHLDKHISSEGYRNISHLSLNELVRKKRHPQKLLFSATLSQDPETLKKLNLLQPVLFSTVSSGTNYNADKTEDYIGVFTTPSELKEKFIIIDAALKPLVISEMLTGTSKNILCFTKSAIEAHKLSKLLSILNPDVVVTEISSLLPKNQREKILCEFSSGLVNVLVCSDVVARGIDISGVKYVISYDPPKHIKSYIHRVGRTGRAGEKGKAVTLLTQTQAPAFNQMLLDVNKDDVKQMAIDEQKLNKRMPEYKAALQKLKFLLQKEDSEQHQKLRKEKALSSGIKKKKKKNKRKH